MVPTGCNQNIFPTIHCIGSGVGLPPSGQVVLPKDLTGFGIDDAKQVIGRRSNEGKPPLCYNNATIVRSPTAGRTAIFPPPSPDPGRPFLVIAVHMLTLFPSLRGGVSDYSKIYRMRLKLGQLDSS
jgi:hypothetical protein